MASRLVAAASAALLMLGAASAHAQDNWRDTAAVQALYGKAKAEAEVVIWAPVQSEVDWIETEFAKRFPGIAVKGNGDLQAATKLIAEARAGRHSVDVWQNSLGGMLEVEKRGLFEKVDWQQYGIDKDRMLFDGEGLAVHNFIYA